MRELILNYTKEIYNRVILFAQALFSTHVFGHFYN